MDNAQCDVQDAQDFQEQGRRTWATEPHPALSRGVELVRDLTKANEILDERLDEHKRALFYGDDSAEVLRGRGGEDYILSQLDEEGWGLLHAALGLGTEAGEAMDAVRPVIAHGEEPDKENLKEELGDILYYAARLADVLDTTLLEAMQANNRKLKERFPEKFTQKDALERDTDAEMEAVSSGAPDATPMEIADDLAVHTRFYLGSVTFSGQGKMSDFDMEAPEGEWTRSEKEAYRQFNALGVDGRLEVARIMYRIQ